MENYFTDTTLTSGQVAEVAGYNAKYLSGFSDPLYFSKVFTEMMGVSPKNYKKQ